MFNKISSQEIFLHLAGNLYLIYWNAMIIYLLQKRFASRDCLVPRYIEVAIHHNMRHHSSLKSTVYRTYAGIFNLTNTVVSVYLLVVSVYLLVVSVYDIDVFAHNINV
jgi:hypothetical protein